jgi:hypothetical protein
MLEVIEDNGGGLGLYILNDDKVIYGHHGYEHAPENLLNDIKSYINYPDTSDWEGNMDDPQAAYDDYKEYDEYGQYTGPQGWQVVYRYTCDGTSTIYHSRMGTAASLLWGREQ